MLAADETIHQTQSRHIGEWNDPTRLGVRQGGSRSDDQPNSPYNNSLPHPGQIHVEPESGTFRIEGHDLVEMTASHKLDAARRVVDFADPRAFGRPSSLHDVRDRLVRNVQGFAPVYTAWYAMLTIAVVVSDPFLLLSWALFGIAAAAGVRCYASDAVLHVRGVPLRRNEQLMLVIPIAVCIAVFGGLLTTALWIAVVGTTVSVCHAVTHRPYDDLSHDAESGYSTYSVDTPVN